MIFVTHDQDEEQCKYASTLEEAVIQSVAFRGNAFELISDIIC